MHERRQRREGPVRECREQSHPARYSGALNRPWMLNDTQLLFGQFGFEPRTAPSFNKDIYGVNNRAYFDALYASWYDLSRRTKPPTALRQFFSDLTRGLQVRKQEDAEVYAPSVPLPHPKDDSLFLRRALLPPDMTATQEYIFACPMETLFSHLQLAVLLPDAFATDARLLFQMHLERDYTVQQLGQFLANPESSPFDAKVCVAEIVGAICSASFEPKELRLMLAPLFRSNPDDYSRILSEIVRANYLKPRTPHNESATVQLQDFRPVLTSHLCDWSARAEAITLADQEPDCALLVRGVRVSTFSFWLRGAWKYFAKFWDERQLDDNQEESDRTTATKELPTLDLGRLLPVSSANHLMHYFFTGDPQITRFLDAYTLLALAREFMFVDANGKPFPDHETLIWQLRFTLGTSMGPSTEECMDAMYIAAEARMQGSGIWLFRWPRRRTVPSLTVKLVANFTEITHTFTICCFGRR